MIYMLTAIVAMSLIMLTLKFFGIKGIYAPQAIMVNYLIALVIAVVKGHAFLSGSNIAHSFEGNWWYLAVISGLLYFGSMDIMTLSTRRAGVSVTTMASRTSVILPIVWSCLMLGERITTWEIIGILLVIGAFAMIICRPEKGHRNGSRAMSVVLPLAVFLSVGFIAVCMKTSQHLIKTGGTYTTDYPIFEVLLFTAAFGGSVLYYGLKERRQAFLLRWPSILGGLCLGTFNYFVTLGLMNGLKYFSSSTFYGIYNISVVVVSTAVGVAAFGEHLDRGKKFGILMALTAIFVLGFLGKSL